MMDPATHTALSSFILYLFIAFVGLALGSFATAMAHRVPYGKSFGAKRSACPECDHVLAARDLVPVFSWFASGGKCRYCKKPVSISYPMTEISVALACVLVFWLKGPSTDTFFIIAAIPFLAALIVIDLRHMILPDKLIIILGALGIARLLFRLWHGDDVADFSMLIEYVINIMTFGGISWLLGFVTSKILKKEALGFGDVKFFAMAGLWLGLSKLSYFFMLSGFFGVVFALILRNRGKEGAFPFGPAIIASFFLLLLTGGSLFS